jgi:DNA repair protein RadD
VPAEVVSSKTPDMIRMQVLRKFRNRELMQLVNVDLFGEGFDLPAIEVVSMARPTQSFTLYAQQFGRALRLMGGKERAIIIDHVGNVKRHGLPDAKREWSMSRRDRRGNGGKPDENIIATTVCVECASAYERIYSTCPYCGHYAMPAERSAPHFVDGDLQELTADVLAKMRGEIDAGIKIPYDASPIVVAGIKNQFAVKQITQQSLRDVIALWAGWHRTLGKTDSEIYRLFFLTYGTDIMTAQTLNAKAASELRNLLQSKLDESGVISV